MRVETSAAEGMKRVAVLEDYQGAVAAQPHWSRLNGRAQIDVYRDAVSGEEALAARLRDYPIVVPIRERTRFPAALLNQLPHLELLALTGRLSGHVDVQAATARGILVTETEGSGPAAIELTMALILAVARRIPQEDRAVRAGGWQTGVGTELAGKSLGILGLGRIGTRIAAFGRLLQMRVLAWGPTLTDERATAAGATRVPLEHLFRESDIVSVHLRLSDTTRRVVNERCFSWMKPAAFFVNTARGGLVDEAALVRTLRDGRIAGAALDVYDEEPLPTAHPLRSLDNVVLSPHMGYVTADAYRLFVEQAVESIVRYLEGELPPRALNPEVMGSRERR
jgi:phosphoglycerate dehydrogenase-like enzyme